MGALIGVLAILAVLGVIVVYAIRSVLSVPTAPPPVPAPEPPSQPRAAPSKPAAGEARSESQGSGFRSEPLLDIRPAERVPTAPPPREMRDPSILQTADPPRDWGKFAVKSVIVTGVSTLLGSPMVLIPLPRIGRRGNVPGGMDSGFAKIPGEKERKGMAAPKLEVHLSASGRIEVNGQETAIEAIEGQFTQLKSVGGAVWYYAEPAEKEPPQATQVLDCALRMGIPVKFAAAPGSPADQADKV